MIAAEETYTRLLSDLPESIVDAESIESARGQRDEDAENSKVSVAAEAAVQASTGKLVALRDFAASPSVDTAYLTEVEPGHRVGEVVIGRVDPGNAHSDHSSPSRSSIRQPSLHGALDSVPAAEFGPEVGPALGSPLVSNEAERTAPAEWSGLRLPSKDRSPCEERSLSKDKGRSTSKNSCLSQTSDGTRMMRGVVKSPKTTRVLGKYCKLVQAYPWCFIFAYTVATGLLILILWRPPIIEYDFSAFVQADGAENARASTVKLASLDKQDFSGRRLDALGGSRERVREHRSLTASDLDSILPQSGQVSTYFSRTLTLYYRPKLGVGFLDDRVLKDMRNIELRLRRMPDWQRYCQKQVDAWNQWLCSPGESLLAFAYPTLMGHNASGTVDGFRMALDGSSNDLFSLTAMFTNMAAALREGNAFADASRFFPKDFAVPAPVDDSAPIAMPSAVRTRFTFCIIYGNSGMDPLTKARSLVKERKRFEDDFVIGKIYGELVQAAKETEYVDLFFQGDTISGYEVTSALTTDILWALGSLAFISCYMWFHIRSFVTAIGCVLIIFVSVPIAYVVTPMEKLTIASFMSLFLITVIDVDVIFIFVDFWDQSKHLESLDARLAYMITRAGRSCLATSTTTALSFFSNLLSVLQALREFGVFMGLSVMAVYVLAMCFLPPLVIIRERGCCRRRRGIDSAYEVESEPSRDMSVGPPRDACVQVVLAVRPSEQDQRREAGSKSVLGLFSICFQGSAGELLMKLLTKYIHCLARVPRCINLLTILCLPLFVVMIILNLKLALSQPEVFPDASNQVQAKKSAAQFITMPNLENLMVPFEEQNVCGATTLAKDTDSSSSNKCRIRWCEMGNSSSVTAPSFGSCWRGPLSINESLSSKFYDDISSCQGVAVVNSYMRDSALSAAAWERVKSSILADLLGSQRVKFSDPAVAPGSSRRADLVVEHWLTGRVTISSLWGASPFNVDRAVPRSANRCKVPVICFFDPSRTCNPPSGWKELETNLEGVVKRRVLGDTASSPLEEPPATSLVAPRPERRRLAADWLKVRAHYDEAFPLIPYDDLLPPNKMFDVVVAWGLRAPKRTALIGTPPEVWSYDPTFKPDNPWAQRAMFRMCDQMPADLLVYQADCWVREFRYWLVKDKNRLFPSRKFDAELIEWNSAKSPDTFAQNIWMKSRKMIACVMRFNLNKNVNTAADKMLKFKETWDHYIDSRNSEASVTASAAWHSSSEWVGAQAQVAIIHGTMETVIVECGLSWFGMVLFTGDPVLAFLVLGLVIVVISGLFFVLTAILHWSIGPIEVIYLIMFLGFSVTYALHMAYNFSQIGEDDARLAAFEPSSVGNEVTHDVKTKEDDLHAPQIPATGPDRGSKGQSEPVSDIERASSGNPGSNCNLRDLRIARGKLAFLFVSGAVLSASVSTVGSSLFLLQCKMAIFQRLGVVILSVSLLSLVFTLVSQPAQLMVFGPSTNPCYKRIPRRVASSLWSKAFAARNKVGIKCTPRIAVDRIIRFPKE